MNRRLAMRLVALVSILLLGAALAACGNSSTPTPTPTQAAAAVTSTPTPTPFDAAAYFQGKTIQIVVGFKPGGGTDTQARFLAQRWGQFIPGNPSITVSNLTPVIAANNRVYQSKELPTTLLYSATPIISEEAQSEAQYSVSKMYVIGAAVTRDATWMIRGNLPYGTLDTLIGKADSTPPITLTMSASLADISGATQLAPLLATDYLDLPVQFKASAQTGTSQTLLEVQRGDVNSFIAGSVWYQLPQREPDWVPTNYVKPFAVIGAQGASVQPNGQGSFDAPSVYDLLKTDQQRSIWDTLVTPDTFAGKNLMAGPNVPVGAVAALRKAWSDAMADSTFRADYEKVLGEPAELADTSGADLQKEWDRIEANYLANKDQVQTIEQNLFNKYVQ